MNELNVFVSVGGTATEQQQAFVRAVEDRLRSEGLVPHTVGRNTFSSDAPLKAVTELALAVLVGGAFALGGKLFGG